LFAACKECHGNNKFYVPLAMDLAVTTGMRLQEIFNLTWGDIANPFSVEGINKRRIVIRKSKTDYKTGVHGRTIVMSIEARYSIISLVCPRRNVVA
jgi:integrase